MTCILLCGCTVRVHDSQAYRKMAVTRERIIRVLELREILQSSQTGFKLCQCCRCLCYPGEYPRLETLVNDITAARYLKLVTVSSFCPFTLISVLMSLVFFVILGQTQQNSKIDENRLKGRFRLYGYGNGYGKNRESRNQQCMIPCARTRIRIRLF